MVKSLAPRRVSNRITQIAWVERGFRWSDLKPLDYVTLTVPFVVTVALVVTLWSNFPWLPIVALMGSITFVLLRSGALRLPVVPEVGVINDGVHDPVVADKLRCLLRASNEAQDWKLVVRTAAALASGREVGELVERVDERLQTKIACADVDAAIADAGKDQPITLLLPTNGGGAHRV